MYNTLPITPFSLNGIHIPECSFLILAEYNINFGFGLRKLIREAIQNLRIKAEQYNEKYN